MRTKAISKSMMETLLSGELQPLLEAVQQDDTLCMELRGVSVSIYYRGGEMLQIKEKPNDYEIVFNTNFCLEEQSLLPVRPDVETAVRLIPQYKQTIDFWYCRYRRYADEVQQVIQRENNTRMATDYIVLSMDCVDSFTKFDMIAMKWPEKNIPRRRNVPPTLVLIEIIYADALLYTRKMNKYLSDLNSFLSDHAWVRSFSKDMSEVFSQKCRLGLIHGVRESFFDTQILPEVPEVILLPIHQNPSGRGMDILLDQLDIEKYRFPVLVSSASTMGYGMFVEQMRLISI